ncbi:sucrose phosphorylase [Pseudoalteromonas tunicata]|nr:sucrose phosphorylase [Pseudoalteromonas tunicata]AXT32632.1 sucrose phosphorylase [Pseudoalteromonas tunicata]
MKNRVQLITYADRITGHDLSALDQLLTTQLKSLFSGVHILPFYFPIDGSDAGFDPIDHTQVDPRLGDWQTVRQIGQHSEIMADLIVNHMSAQSEEFLDVLANAEASPYWDLFLKETDIFPAGITQQQAKQIYRPRPGSCFSQKTLNDGRVINFWTTFTDNQIDINVESPAGQAYLERVLTLFAQNGVKIIRLDAAGYAIKRAGTSCFMTDESFAFVDTLSRRANELGMETIAEIHSHFETQIAVANRVNRVYDFALPPLVLHTLFSLNCTALLHWLDIAPRNCLTVLDTHDGIGIIDAGPQGEKPGLLNAAEVDALVEKIHTNSDGQSRLATGAAASNLDLYQVNCTFYDALGQDDFAYLLARAIQFFSPGVPQVYYAGLFAVPNAMALLGKTNVGRDINRPYLTGLDLNEAFERPIVKGLMKLIEFRNTHDAFNGDFSCTGTATTAQLSWQKHGQIAQLNFDLAKMTAEIIIDNGIEKTGFVLADLLVGLS